MTGPLPGQGDDTPPQHAGGTPLDRDEPNPYFGDADEDLPPIGAPPDGPNRKVIIAIVAAVVLIVGAGFALWFGVGPGKTGGTPVAAPSGRHPAQVGQPASASGSATPTRPSGGAPVATTAPNASGANSSAAYDVGMCFNEVGGTTAGKVELNPVQCGGPDAVFVTNDVVASIADCDTG
jgi:hypothetical protein